MNKQPFYSKTIGPVSATFLAQMQKSGKTLFTLNEAIKIYNKDRQSTIKFLSDLIRRNVLARINSGTYLILLTGQENAQLSSWPIIANALAEPSEYFISHYSAMRIHGMTTHPLLNIYITMYKRHRIKKVAHISYHFIFTKHEYFWGKHMYWATKQNKVYVSDIERTLLDGLERPDLCGGIKEVVRGLWIKRNEINWEKITNYARKFRTKAAVQRLGYLLELFELSPESISILKEIIYPAKGYILLDPNTNPEGKYLNRWHIQLNMNTEELKASIWS